MSEPFYVRQTAEPMSVNESRIWFVQCRREAVGNGATWGRFSSHPHIDGLLLVEAWRERPKREGKPRYALVAT